MSITFVSFPNDVNRHTILTLVGSAMLSIPLFAVAEPDQLSSLPLFLGASDKPANVMILVDNSTSMDQDIMTSANWERSAYDKSAPCFKRDQNEAIVMQGMNPVLAKPDENCGEFWSKGSVRITASSGQFVDLVRKSTLPLGVDDGFLTPSFPEALPDIDTIYSEFTYLSDCSFDPVTTALVPPPRREDPPAPRDFIIDYAACRHFNVITSNCTEAPSAFDKGFKSLANCGNVESFEWRVRASDFNRLYYNPKTNYLPWTGIEGNADFSQAKDTPLGQPDATHVVNLGKDVPLGIDPQELDLNPNHYTTPTTYISGTQGFTYYIWLDEKGFSGSRPKRGSNINMVDGNNDYVDLWDSRIKVTISNDAMTFEKEICRKDESASTGFTCQATSIGDGDLPVKRGLKDEKINIANWYESSRRKLNVVKGAISNLLEEEGGFRYGFAVTSKGDPIKCDGTWPAWDPAKGNYGKDFLNDKVAIGFPKPDDDGVINFQEHINNVRQKLFSLPMACGTPLRQSLKIVGDFFVKDEGQVILDKCQQHIVLILTEGFYTDAPPADVGDEDKDNRVATLADVAKKYYTKEITFDGEKIPLALHTVPVAFGSRGVLTDSDGSGWPDTRGQDGVAADLKESSDWGDPVDSSDCQQKIGEEGKIFYGKGSCAAKIDDLWHAAFNSKGAYLSASSPEELVSGLRRILKLFVVALSSAGTASFNSATLQEGSLFYQTVFKSKDWIGQLLAYKIGTDGKVSEKPEWDAGVKLNDLTDENRQIISYNPDADKSIAFSSEKKNYSESQLNYLDTDADDGSSGRLDDNVQFLRGKGANGSDDPFIQRNDFRARSVKLGDIVNSNAVYLSIPSAWYTQEKSLEGYPAYGDFVKKWAGRKATIYVGANDGMLHAFRAGDGQELFAYVPTEVYKRLSALTSRLYTHQYYVDGPITVSDAVINGEWRTILVSGLGAGGQGYFALDVTDPADFEAGLQTSPGKVFLWEFTDGENTKNNDPDLGYTFSQTQIAHMHINSESVTGQWAAIFGNGYYNTDTNDDEEPTPGSGTAVLYIVDLATGSLIAKIDTGEGNKDQPNGLSSPAAIDVDKDYLADYVYAGDLYGNIWKFDVRGEPGTWKVAYKLYEDTSAGKQRPITTRPSIGRHPTGEGYMVYFGTGKYMDKSDNREVGEDEPKQRFLGIWDAPDYSDEGDSSTPVKDDTSKLFRQEIVSSTIAKNGFTVRTTRPPQDKGEDIAINWRKEGEDGKIDYAGWYIEFPPGERQVSNSLLHSGRIIFSTLTPATKCEIGGESWIMVLNAADGGQTKESSFDFNNDAEFSKEDLIDGVIPASGRKSNVGIISTPGLIESGNRLEAVICGAKGCESEAQETDLPKREVLGRQSFRELPVQH